ncbi:hypothetical protein CBR_g27751 [Chara braunii]|uniref:Myb-like domain-containing protein n=1 Tax=Chara braunii TaxID=69332 RepID=A0A388L897_CHABU|nr:hypothetical protein CBR_g27751 [Chara braunii]|eukprot:GBG78526.1 hypothetical protein CBR_g27751 [Chara braunii]
MVEDDALMADVGAQHRFKKRKEWYEWVHDRMADHRFPHRSAEDCHKKWQGMMAAAKLILNKCENASGKPSYWDMTMEERKAEQVPVGFEKALWEAIEWQLNRPSIKCDNTLASENLSGNAGGPSTETGPPQPSSGKSGSDGRATEDSDNVAKTRRTNTSKARMDDTTSGGTVLGRAMEDATRSYNEGLDKAATTLRRRRRRPAQRSQRRLVTTSQMPCVGGTPSSKCLWGFLLGVGVGGTAVHSGGRTLNPRHVSTRG